jgi:hypothetical protein
MADRMRETMDGTPGHFWTELGDVYDLDESRDGYVRLVDNNLFHVGTLRTRDFNSEFGSNRERLPRPEAIYAMTASTLIEIALGLEYWTKFHRELGRAWAQARKLRKKRFEPRGCGLHDLRRTPSPSYSCRRVLTLCAATSWTWGCP